MTAEWQEWIALAVVSVSAFALGMGFYRKFLALPLSQWLLRKGRVKLAMRIHPSRRKSKGARGGDCCG